MTSDADVRTVADRVHRSGAVEFWQLTDTVWYLIADQQFHDLLCPHLYLLDFADFGDALL